MMTGNIKQLYGTHPRMTKGEQNDPLADECRVMDCMVSEGDLLHPLKHNA